MFMFFKNEGGLITDSGISLCPIQLNFLCEDWPSESCSLAWGLLACCSMWGMPRRPPNVRRGRGACEMLQWGS